LLSGWVARFSTWAMVRTVSPEMVGSGSLITTLGQGSQLFGLVLLG